MANRDHIELLFKNYYQPLHHLASIMLRDEDQAADIVHDVFASLLKNPDLSEFQTGYLFRAVRNRCLNRIESKGFQEKVRNLLYLESEEYDSENWPEEEMVSRIHEIIDSELTPQKHKIMTLRFGDGSLSLR